MTINTLREADNSEDLLQDPATRAKGLARLLIYAVLDATDLGSGRTAETVCKAIEQLKSEYGLNDHEIMHSGA